MLDKLGGKYAPHPSAGPHKLRECLPLCIFIRNRLKYALSGREVSLIVKQRLVKVDNKVRTDETYPAGFMGASEKLSSGMSSASLTSPSPPAQMSSRSKSRTSTSA